jgi:hypothetical protein
MEDYLEAIGWLSEVDNFVRVTQLSTEPGRIRCLKQDGTCSCEEIFFYWKS